LPAAKIARFTANLLKWQMPVIDYPTLIINKGFVHGARLARPRALFLASAGPFTLRIGRLGIRFNMGRRAVIVISVIPPVPAERRDGLTIRNIPKESSR
jgi:hypothetical protein